MIQQSQGLVADRTRENLTATDAAIVRFRRLLINPHVTCSKTLEPEAPISTTLIATSRCLGHL